MRRRIPGLALLLLLLFPLGKSGIQATDDSVEPNKFFREFVGLNNDQIREIREGKAVAKILDSSTADQVFVFGSVYIDSTPERYLKFASDVVKHGRRVRNEKGEKRPHDWDNSPIEGRMSAGAIRSQILAISKAVKDKNLSHKDRLKYLDHAERLDRELKVVTKAKLQRQIAELEMAES